MIRFSAKVWPDRILRRYQAEAFETILRSVVHREGHQFAVVFSRQSGKDELLAQLIANLLLLFSGVGGSIVIAAPSYSPQGEVNEDRVLDLLREMPFAVSYTKQHGYVVRVGKATARYLSASPQANTRGQTASLLLVANEAQHISADQWDAVFDPMAVASNATTLFMGTVWDRDSLLSRQMRYLEDQSARDGFQRLFLAPWQRVAAEVPVYGERVRERIAQFGEDHPFVRTEYCLMNLTVKGDSSHPIG